MTTPRFTKAVVPLDPAKLLLKSGTTAFGGPSAPVEMTDNTVIDEALPSFVGHERWPSWPKKPEVRRL